MWLIFLTVFKAIQAMLGIASVDDQANSKVVDALTENSVVFVSTQHEIVQIRWLSSGTTMAVVSARELAPATSEHNQVKGDSPVQPRVETHVKLDLSTYDMTRFLYQVAVASSNSGTHPVDHAGLCILEYLGLDRLSLNGEGRSVIRVDKDREFGIHVEIREAPIQTTSTRNDQTSLPHPTRYDETIDRQLFLMNQIQRGSSEEARSQLRRSSVDDAFLAADNRFSEVQGLMQRARKDARENQERLSISLDKAAERRWIQLQREADEFERVARDFYSERKEELPSLAREVVGVGLQIVGMFAGQFGAFASGAAQVASTENGLPPSPSRQISAEPPSSQTQTNLSEQPSANPSSAIASKSLRVEGVNEPSLTGCFSIVSGGAIAGYQSGGYGAFLGGLGAGIASDDCRGLLKTWFHGNPKITPELDHFRKMGLPLAPPPTKVPSS